MDYMRLLRARETRVTPQQISGLSRDEVLNLIRCEGLPVEHSMFATIHMRGQRKEGWPSEELDVVADELADSDLERWRRELAAHYSRQSSSSSGGQ